MIRSSLTALAILTTTSDLRASAQELPVLVAGETIAGELVGDPGAVQPARFELAADGGVVTVRAESFAIDVDLVLERDGETLLVAQVGGLGTDARASFEAEPGARYGIAVRSATGRPGPFSVRAVAGPEPLPTGSARFEAELAYWKAALEAARTREDRGREIVALAAAGQFAFELGRHDESLDLFETCLERATRAGQRTFQTTAHVFIGSIQAARLRHDEAVSHLHAARDQLTTGSAGARPFRPLIARSLGDLELARGEWDVARVEYERMLDEADAVGDLVQAGEALGRLAELARLEGSVELALELHDRRIELASSVDAARDADALALALHDKGRCLAACGEIEEARDTLDAALDAARHEVTRIHALGTLGQVEARAGRLGRAVACYERSLAASRTIGNQRATALCLQGLADVAIQLADHERAEELLVQAMEQDGGAELESLLRSELGFLRSEQGRLDEAFEAHAEALRAAAGAGLVEQALRCRINLAEVEQRLGRLDDARSSAQRAHDEASDLGLREIAALASVNLAYTLLLAGEPQSARPIALAALETLSSVGHGRARHAPMETLARAALALEEVDEAWRWIAEAFDAIDLTGAETSSADEASRFRSKHAWWGETLAQDATAAALRAAGTEGERASIAARGLSRTGAWKDRVLVESAGDRRLRWRDVGVSVSELREEVLGPGAALIEFAPGSERLYAYVLDDERIGFVDLGPRAGIEALALRYAEGLAAGAPMREIQEDGAGLYEELLAPALSALARRPDVLVVGCSDEVAGVPFDALVIDRGEDGSEPVFVLDQFAVAQGLSGSMLLDLARRRAAARPCRALLIADPVYASEATPLTAMRDPDPYGFLRLEATRDEACAIARLLIRDGAREEDAARLLDLVDERSGLMHADACTLLLGSEATREHALAELPRHTVLHVGAHGFVDALDPLQNAIALSFDPERSGLLTAAEVIDLELDLDLAVLSACSTARGKVRRGEGAQSLARAFVQAGARAVVASLWPVRDLETSILMRDLYREWLGEGLHPALALRQAKLAQRSRAGTRGARPATDRNEGPSAGHPSLWAACTYAGLPPGR